MAIQVELEKWKINDDHLQIAAMGDKTRMIDEMLSRAIHANPNDPYAWHMLGNFLEI